MKKIIFALLISAASLAYADDGESFVTGFAHGFEQAAYGSPQVIVIYQQPNQADQAFYQQETEQYQREQLDLERQQLQEQQNADAWYNK